MLRNYLFNGYRRLSGEALYFLIPFGVGETLSPFSPRTAFRKFVGFELAHPTILLCSTRPQPNYPSQFLGYGVYSWAKSYDEWQNSKAGHAEH